MHKIQIHRLLRLRGVSTLGALAWFVLGVCAPSAGRADTIADSRTDWSASGEQGVNGWTYGYYNRTDDGNNSYAADEFILFEPAHWRGTGWRLAPSRSIARCLNNRLINAWHTWIFFYAGIGCTT